MSELFSMKSLFNHVLISICTLFSIISKAHCSPPDDPVKCSFKNFNCTIKNAYGTFPDRKICSAGAVLYPTTEDELISIVADATKMKRKMKVATTSSHSIPKLVCPDGHNGLLISTKYLDHTVNVDKSAMTITAESGITLRQLINEAAGAGLALPYAPYWWGVTIGGILSTGAHGSTLWDLGSAVHDYVIWIRIVTPAPEEEGYAKVRTLEIGDPELDAARVSLGVLGVISQVTLKLQRMFKRSITLLEKKDSELGDQVKTLGQQHEFADIIWYPSQKKAIYRIDDRVSPKAYGDGVNDFIGFRSTFSVVLAATRINEEAQEFHGDAEGKCGSGVLSTSVLSKTAYGLTNNRIAFVGYPVIGYHNHLQSSGTCIDSSEDALNTACPWDPRVEGLFFHQTTISIALSKVNNFIEDIKNLVSLEPKALCGIDIYNGILMRYVKASSAYLGKQEDGIDFDITYYRSKDPKMPRLFEDFLEEIEQMAVFKYGGLPHWGKNRNLAFDGAIKKYKNANEFLKVKELYDPLGLFSSEWTDQILGLKRGITILKEGCALEGLCICSKDSHCAPKKGYFCRPGKVYHSARVCTYISSY